MRVSQPLRSAASAALPLHLVDCLPEVDGVGWGVRGRCDREVVALCAQAGTLQRLTSATRALPDAFPDAPPEADGALRAELLRFVQRKLFAEDAGSQAAGLLVAPRCRAHLTAVVLLLL